MNCLYALLGFTALAGTILIHKARRREYQTLTPAIPKSPINPNNTIFIFDIHGVLFRHDIKKMISLIVHAPHLGRLLLQLCNPYLIYDFVRLAWSGAVPEKCVKDLSAKYPKLKPFVPLSIAVANCQIPQQKTINLVNQLIQQGYTLHILSNIGELFFGDLQQKFPAIFKNFTAVRVASPADDYLSKPNKGIFRDYLQHFNPEHKNIIFIDDKLKNIKVALEEHISSILFESPEQLEDELSRLEII